MSEVDRMKERLAVVEEEFNNLPLLAGQIMKVLQLDPDQIKNLDAAKWRSCFRMLQCKFILESLIRRSQFGDVEKAADILGEDVIDSFKSTTDRLVGEMLNMAK